jgi:hypothetical protein
MRRRAGDQENNSIAEPNFTWLFRLLGWFFGEGLLMTRGPDRPTSRVPSSPEEPTLTAQVQALLDHIRALDKSMDEARVNKIREH